jgi:putative membrane protein
MKRLISRCLLALALAGAIPSAFAQDASSSPAVDATTPPSTPSPTPPAPISAADKTFLEQAASSGLAEKMASEVIADISTSTKVEDFANSMIRAHSKINSQVQMLAHLKGLELVPTLSKNDTTAIQTLVGKTGADADAFYGQTYGIQAHESAIVLFTDEVQNGQDDQIQAFARKTLPYLKMHLKMAQRVFGASTGSGTGSTTTPPSATSTAPASGSSGSGGG